MVDPATPEARQPEHAVAEALREVYAEIGKADPFVPHAILRSDALLAVVAVANRHGIVL